jgi:hypothetical protein
MEDGHTVSELLQLTLEHHVLFLHIGEAHFEVEIPPLDGALFCLESFDLLPLPLPGGLSCAAVAEDPLDPSLLLLIFRLCSLSGE